MSEKEEEEEETGLKFRWGSTNQIMKLEEYDLLDLITNDNRPVKLNLEGLSCYETISKELEQLKQKNGNIEVNITKLKNIFEDVMILKKIVKELEESKIENYNYYITIDGCLKKISSDQAEEINSLINKKLAEKNKENNDIQDMDIEEEEIKEEPKQNKKKKKNKRDKSIKKNKAKEDPDNNKKEKTIKEQIIEIYYKNEFTNLKNTTYTNKIFKDDYIDKEYKTLINVVKNYFRDQNYIYYIDKEHEKNEKEFKSRFFYLKYESINFNVTHKYIWYVLFNEKRELHCFNFIILKVKSELKENLFDYHVYFESDKYLFCDKTNLNKINEEFFKITITDTDGKKYYFNPTISTCQSFKIVGKFFKYDNEFYTNMDLIQKIKQKSNK